MAIYDAAMQYQSEGRPLVIFAGKEYAAPAPPAIGPPRAPSFLGVRAVFAETYERIHRSNLVGMGVLPLQFIEDGWHRLGLTGEEIVTIRGLDKITPAHDAAGGAVSPVRPQDGPLPGAFAASITRRNSSISAPAG